MNSNRQCGSQQSQRLRKILLLVLITLLQVQSQNAFGSIKANPPIYDDYYLPQIIKYSAKPEVNTDIDLNGQQFWNVTIALEVQFKVHRNSVREVEIYHRFLGNPDVTCAIFNLNKSLPGPYGGNLVTAGELIARQQQGDWFLETHKIAIPVLKDSYKIPCLGTYVLGSFKMIDSVGRLKSIMIESPISEPFYAALNVSPASLEIHNAKKSFLPEYSCPLVNDATWLGSPIACLESFIKDYAVIIDNGTLVKAAAVKAAALVKKATITCVKGKVTKKVTAVKPKCPAGYKKK